jgi:hypothetical protein
MTTDVTTMTPRGRRASAAAAADREAAAREAARRLYDAEIALHIARQTGVDAWISAAYDRLHEAIAAHTAALTPTGSTSQAA